MGVTIKGNSLEGIKGWMIKVDLENRYEKAERG
jgi:hypothetical protein